MKWIAVILFSTLIWPSPFTQLMGKKMNASSSHLVSQKRIPYKKSEFKNTLHLNKLKNSRLVSQKQVLKWF